MNKFNMTFHAKVDRIDRLSLLLTHVGYNEFILEVKEPEKVYRLTDTGIIFVFNAVGDTLITGYLGQRLKVASLYKSTGVPAPKTVWKTIVRNEKKYSFLYSI